MALIMTESGHKAIAIAMKNQQFYLAVSGLSKSTPWKVEEEPPYFDPKNDDLEQIYGFRKATRVYFAKEDPDGELIVANKRWTTSNTPTRHIYIEFRLDAEDAINKTIYQIGVYINTKPKEGTPEGKLFLTPSDVQDKGTLLVAENIRPVHRYEGTREIFEFVLTF